MTHGLVERHLTSVILELINEEPVVVINGARAVGKSTLLSELARVHRRRVLDLDDAETRTAIERDRHLVMDLNPPVFIDEFQHVPDLLLDIKAELNKGMTPGRFVLTGSTRYLTTPTLSSALTGRATLVGVWPLSRGELRGIRERFIDHLFEDPDALAKRRPSRTSREDYRRAVLAGGFPIALERTTQRARSRWYRDYIETVTSRDVLEITKIRQRELLPVLLRKLASQTAQVLEYTTLGRVLGVDDTVVRDYVGLLDIVFLVHRLPAWGRTLGSRIAGRPKVHVVDSGLGAWLLGITERRLATLDPAALTEYGHLLETFAVNEVIKQTGWAETPVRFGHYRTHDGAEVDLVLESEEGLVAGIEVKAGSNVAGSDLRGLEQLRGKLGNRFVAGVALYTGARAYTYSDRIHVLPLDALWSG